MIYIIQAENGHIKIGHSAMPLVRLDAMRFASPLQIRLIAVFPGGRHEENNLHKQFEASRRHNEWFAADQAIIKFVAEVWGRGLDEVEEWVTDFSVLRETKKQASARRRSETCRAKRREMHQRLWRAHVEECTQ